MIKYLNDCVGCGMPCIDCGRKRAPHMCCDVCGNEADTLFRLDGYSDYHICKGCFEDLIESLTAIYTFEDEMGWAENG